MSDRLEHYKQALAYFGENKYPEAIAEYEAALADDPDWTEGLHGLAMAQMHAGELDDAIATGLRIAELDERDAFAYTSLSMFYQRKGMIEEAEQAAAKARMLNWHGEAENRPGS